MWTFVYQPNAGKTEAYSELFKCCYFYRTFYYSTYNRFHVKLIGKHSPWKEGIFVTYTFLARDINIRLLQMYLMIIGIVYVQ